MAAPMRELDEISTSSSESDGEEQSRLRSAVWDLEKDRKPVPPKKVSALPTSKRESFQDPFDVSDDYRVAATTPEYKAFVAKKLTAYLDRFVEDIEKNEDKWRTEVPEQEPADDSFQLFSTSKADYKPPAVRPPQPAWKRNGKGGKHGNEDATSSSDSDEEQQRLRAAAVTGDFILEGSRGQLHEKEVPEELDLVPSRNLETSELTLCRTPQEEEHQKKKKKKHKHEKRESSCDANEEPNKRDHVTPPNRKTSDLAHHETQHKERHQKCKKRKKQKQKKGDSPCNGTEETREPVHVMSPNLKTSELAHCQTYHKEKSKKTRKKQKHGEGESSCDVGNVEDTMSGSQSISRDGDEIVLKKKEKKKKKSGRTDGNHHNSISEDVR